jgi:hypothetical protein
MVIRSKAKEWSIYRNCSKMIISSTITRLRRVLSWKVLTAAERDEIYAALGKLETTNIMWKSGNRSSKMEWGG